jgi:hypothetical protein
MVPHDRARQGNNRVLCMVWCGVVWCAVYAVLRCGVVWCVACVCPQCSIVRHTKVGNRGVLRVV